MHAKIATSTPRISAQVWEYQGKRLRIMDEMSRIAKAKPQAASRMSSAVEFGFGFFL